MAGDYLLKTEATVYSFADLQKDGTTEWDGVTNPTAVGSHPLSVSTSSDTAATTTYSTVPGGAVGKMRRAAAERFASHGNAAIDKNWEEF